MTYRLLSLGCQMNVSDAERISAVLQDAGYREAATEQEADILGVVACSVRQKAIDRIYSRIHEWNQWKRDRALLTFVSGCILPEDERKFLRLFDLVFRIDDLPQLPELIRTCGVVTAGADAAAALGPQRSVTLQRTEEFWGVEPRYGSSFAAYVPIQNGCDKFCTFCAVPYTRGREVSRPQADILREVESLLERGYQVITLLGQNVNSYGRDRGGAQPGFARLLGAVGALCDQAEQQVWVYFTSPHPSDMSRDVLEQIARYDALAKQIHLPLQSGDDKVLIRMNRNYRFERYRRIVADVREVLPTATLFTDLIVGFCGETEEQFAHTRDAMQELCFDMAYVAAYSPRPGAAAARWPDDVPHVVKKQRLAELSAVLQDVALPRRQVQVDTQVPVLIEAADRKPGMLLARTEGRIPVRVAGPPPLIGTRGVARIQRARPLSLEGELVADDGHAAARRELALAGAGG